MKLISSILKLIIRQILPGRIQFRFLGFCLVFVTPCLLAQTEIPLNTWRMHSSYNNISQITLGNNKVFAASENAIIVLEKSDNSLAVYSKLNGLSATSIITGIAYNQSTDQLLVAYTDGNLDVVKDNEVINFNRLKNSDAINGSKTINHVLVRSNYAYLSTDYGLVVFDLNSIEVKETWRDLGSNGSKLKIYKSQFLGDTIFLATEKGVIAGNINSNLLDYNNWKRFDQGVFNTSILSITSFNEKIYAGINNVGLYWYKNGAWTLESILQNSSFTSITASISNMLIIENNQLWRLSVANTLTSVSDDIIKQPRFAIEDDQGELWIGDRKDGLVSNVPVGFLNYLPNGPQNSNGYKLKYNGNSIYSLAGGYSSNFVALGVAGNIDIFKQGAWSTENLSASDFTDIDFNGTISYIASFGNGLLMKDERNNITIFNDSNSPLRDVSPSGKSINITALKNSTAGLWVANYGALNSLHLLKHDNTWESFSFPQYGATRFPTELIVDLNGNVWMVLNPSQGGGLLVFDKLNNRIKYLTDQAGSGALPSKAVRSITIDGDGYVWVGTDSGVAYFTDPYNIFTASVDAIKPIFEFRYLLKNEKITVITVDGANRKWIGTEKGAWLFNPTGEKQIYNFTTENSPLLSNVIRDIEVNPISGEVFFSTQNGIASYRADATNGDSSNDMKIFPNPVTSSFNGTIGISGISVDAAVKITDVGGNLVWQTNANGGTATWNIRDYNGRRVATGVYVVFATSVDGAETAVGKIAIIE